MVRSFILYWYLTVPMKAIQGGTNCPDLPQEASSPSFLLVRSATTHLYTWSDRGIRGERAGVSISQTQGLEPVCA